MSGTRSRTAQAARRAVALAIGILVAVLLPVVAEGAQPAPSTTATHIRFDSIATPSIPLPDTPGTDGLAFVVAGLIGIVAVFATALSLGWTPRLTTRRADQPQHA